MTREEQIDLIYDALMDLGAVQCDCDRVIDPSRFISRSDVTSWLDKRHLWREAVASHIKEVRATAERHFGRKIIDTDAQLIELARRESEAGQKLRDTIFMLGSSQLRR